MARIGFSRHTVRVRNHCLCSLSTGATPATGGRSFETVTKPLSPHVGLPTRSIEEPQGGLVFWPKTRDRAQGLHGDVSTRRTRPRDRIGWWQKQFPVLISG